MASNGLDTSRYDPSLMPRRPYSLQMQKYDPNSALVEISGFTVFPSGVILAVNKAPTMSHNDYIHFVKTYLGHKAAKSRCLNRSNLEVLLRMSNCDEE